LRGAQHEIFAAMARATELENAAVRPKSVSLGTQTEATTESLGTQTIVDQHTQTTADVGTRTTTNTGTSPSHADAWEKEKSDLQRQNGSLRGDVARLRRPHDERGTYEKKLDNVLAIVTMMNENGLHGARQTRGATPISKSSDEMGGSFDEKPAYDTERCHKCPWFKK
jgi:hypothetical protein